MTDRGRLVYALLRTLLAWAPAPRSRTSSISGFVSAKRRCLNCATVGRWNAELRRKVDAGCPHCAGTGVRPVKDPMDDPLKSPPPHPLRKTGFGGTSGDDIREARRRRDDEIARLDQQLSTSEDDAPADLIDRAVELRDHMYKQGSYADLEAALAQLRDHDRTAYEVAMTVAYQPFGEAPIEAIHAAVLAVCEVLGSYMDGPIRVPAHVAVTVDQELERVAREGRGALWHGKGDWHKLKRSQRDALILAMSESGLSATAIGQRIGLKRRRVQDILAQQRALRDPGVASGPAA